MEDFTYFISKGDINEFPIKAFEGPVEIIDTLEQAKTVLKNLKKQTILGFDTESRPSFRKGEHHPISLIQFATGKEAFLFRINEIGIPDELKNILSNPDICKIGLGILQEKTEMDNNFKINCEGFIDLEKIAKQLKFKQRGVRALSAFFLKLRISKSAQKSNWERKILTDQQIRYAATDAWVCLKIFNEMKKQKFISIKKNNICIKN